MDREIAVLSASVLPVPPGLICGGIGPVEFGPSLPTLALQKKLRIITKVKQVGTVESSAPSVTSATWHPMLEPVLGEVHSGSGATGRLQPVSAGLIRIPDRRYPFLDLPRRAGRAGQELGRHGRPYYD